MQNEDAVERFGLFGSHFGVAFQMADDLLDLQPVLLSENSFCRYPKPEPQLSDDLGPTRVPRIPKCIGFSLGKQR